MPDKTSLQEFLVEAEDIVHSISDNFRQMQSIASSSKDINPDIVNELFRGLHSLKGLAATLGFTRLTMLSHRLEDLLGDIRLERITISNQLMDTLFEGIDVIIRMLSNINDKGTEGFDISFILEKIEQFEKDHGNWENNSITAEAFISPELVNGLSEYEIKRLKAKIEADEFVYKIKAGFTVKTIDEEMERLQGVLKKVGEIISLTPASGFSSDDIIFFDIVFASKDIKTEYELDDILEVKRIIMHKVESLRIPEHNMSVHEEKTSVSSARSITKTVRVDIERLDVLLNTVGEIFLLNDTLSQVIKNIKMEYGRNKDILTMNKASKGLYKRLTVLRDDLIDLRLVPVSYLFDRLSDMANKLCRELSKGIEIKLYGGDTTLDKSMIEGLADPLMHIIRNAVDHGIEDEKTRCESGKPKNGTIELTASHKDSKINIEIKDDGAGIDFRKILAVALKEGLIQNDENPNELELLELLFRPGFSTRNDISQISGRGVGLDVVAKNIAALGGMIDIETNYGKGTKFSIVLPLTLLIAKALMVIESGRNYAIPFNYISEIIALKDNAIKKTGIKEVFNIRGHFIPVIRLKDALKFNQETHNSLMPVKGIESNNLSNKDRLPDEVSHPLYRKASGQHVIVVGLAEKRAGIVVDKIKSQREILIKPLNELIGFVPGITGFTEIDSKSIVPVLDVGGIIEKCKI